MRYLIFFSALFFSHSIFSQSHSDYGMVKVLKAYTQSTFGYNAGYYVEFSNNSAKDVDGLKWEAKFYDNFGDLKGSREGQWQSGNFTDPIAAGGTAKDLETVWVEGATKVFIRIKLVHYTDGTVSKRN